MKIILYGEWYNMDKELQYRNPLVYQRSDPHVLKHGDMYYFTGTVPGYDYIELRSAKSLNELTFANAKIVWKKHKSGPMGAQIWAPEIHYFNNKWYIYFTAGDAEDIWRIRPYVLECSGDPMVDEWKELGRIDVGYDSFSLDMTTFFVNGVQYTAWAQTIDSNIGSEIFIARMKDPCTLESVPVSISKPEYEWEKQGFKVNEGPAVLQRNGKIILTYSASDTGWRYCMGMLWAEEGAELLDPSSWHKSSEPVFRTSEKNSQYGPGHNSFTTDGDDDVLIYHCRNYKEIEGDPLDDPNRHARAKRFTYDENGLPVFGEPEPENI